MSDSECLFVGDFGEKGSFKLPAGCFISANNNINTELENYFCDTPVGGATVGTLNLSAYPRNLTLAKGIQRASVTIPWLRKYDAINDKLYFIFVGPGRSSNIDGPNVSLEILTEYKSQMLSASSQSGPSSLYSDLVQDEGFGMKYTGGPLDFDTASESACTFSNMGLGKGDYYLQSFYLDGSYGSPITVTYTFVYQA